MINLAKKYWKKIVFWLIALDVVVLGGGSILTAVWYFIIGEWH